MLSQSILFYNRLCFWFLFFLVMLVKKKSGLLQKGRSAEGPYWGAARLMLPPTLVSRRRLWGILVRDTEMGPWTWLAGRCKGCTLAPSAVGDAGPRTTGGSERRRGWDWEREIVGMKN